MAYVVAIDGPAGAGKSTIARGVADRLGIVRVDTGSIYRAVTLAVMEAGADDDASIDAVAASLELTIQEDRVIIGDRDVSLEIRSPEVNAAVSRVSAIPRVRTRLLELQRRLGRAHPVGAVLEGRDIGTVVFPDAEVKIFLTASPEERARRRLKDLEAAGHTPSFEDVLASIEARDRYDSGRAVAPLRPASDAVRVDSTGKSLEEVIDEITTIVQQQVGA